MNHNSAQIIEYSNYLDQMVQQCLYNNLVSICSSSLKLIRPRRIENIVEWAEKNIILPDTFPIPGPFRIINSPHLKAIFKAIEDPQTREVNIMGCSQYGKTLFYSIVWAYFVVNDPCAMLIGHPSDTDLRSFALQKLEPMIDASPILRKKIAKKKRGSSTDSSMRIKMFFGGYTELISLTSSKRTRQRSVKRTFSDDIDAIDLTIAMEGDPVFNLEKRTTAFKYDYLHINCSVPRLEGESRIQKKFEAGSMEYYHVKCKHCNANFIFDDDNIVCEEDRDLTGKVINQLHETAQIACPECGAIYSDRERIEMLRNGFWIAKHPERKMIRSFHLNQASSTLTTLSAIAKEKYEANLAYALGNDEIMESYVNGVKGIPYKRIITRETDAKILLDRREDYIDPQNPYIIPNGVLLATSFTDVQRGKQSTVGRLEYEVWGWGYGEECWLIDKKVFDGIVEEKGSGAWVKLKAYQDKVTHYTRKDGVKIPVKRYFYDSGYASDAVYDYCAYKAAKGHIATKGANNYGAMLLPKQVSVVNGGKTILISIGTQKAKETLFGRLNEVTEPGPKYIHHTKCYCDVPYFEGLTAEVAETKTISYAQIMVYVRKKGNPPNEPIDLWVGAFAAMKTLNVNWDALKKKRDEEALELKETGGDELKSLPELLPDKKSLSHRENKIKEIKTGNKVTNW